MSLTRLHRPAFASAFAAMLGIQSASAATIADDFNGAAGPPNPATWVTTATNGSASVAVDGSSNLVVNVGIPNGSQRAMAVTVANDFDAFTSPLRIDLDNIAVGGDPTGGVFNSAFVVYGRSNTDAAAQFFPNGGQMAYGLGVSIQLLPGGLYNLHVNEFSDNDTDSNPSDGTMLYANYALSGAPTGLTLVIDGASREMGVEIAGATFSSSGLATLTQAFSENFTAANMTVGGVLQSRVSVGAINGGTVTTGTSYIVGSINVGPVPEPASLGLMAGGLLFAAARKPGTADGSLAHNIPSRRLASSGGFRLAPGPQPFVSSR